MDSELLHWYERELTFLKKEAVQFARKYPELAGNLGLHGEEMLQADPHLDRLIQSVALLAADPHRAPTRRPLADILCVVSMISSRRVRIVSRRQAFRPPGTLFSIVRSCRSPRTIR